MLRVLTVIILLLQFNSYGQVDPKKLDSLSRSIDSSAKLIRSDQDRFIKVQDSAYHSEVNKALGQGSRNHDQFLAEKKRREEKERQQAIVRIGLSVLIFIVPILVLLRKRKPKS